MSSDDENDDNPLSGIGGQKLRPPEGEDLKKLRTKLANIPTIEQLLAEADPHAMSEEQLDRAEQIAKDLISKNPQSEEQMKTIIKELMKKYKTDCKKSVMLAGYQRLKAKSQQSQQQQNQNQNNNNNNNNGFVSNPFLEQYLLSKAPRSQSGVLVVTVFTSAFPEEDENGKKQNFSCKWNCYYCPNEPGQPRSYLLNEPGVRRANRLDFDAVRQFVDRVAALVAIGHPADKVELLVLGGTWESYNLYYQEKFIRDLFYAANTFFDAMPKRGPLTLLEEQTRNEDAQCKIIGVTLETRPDTINPEMLVKLRRLGCTRVQIGVQHTDDSVLSLVNREATRGDVTRAIRLLKDACFKVDIHLMPDLPGSSPEVDRKMFDDVLHSPDLQADQWKIYPCQTTPFSVIQKWYEEGRYRSYGLEQLIDVILYAKRRVHPWVRLNRVIRDIPVEYVLEGVEVANLRQLLQKKLEKGGEWCKCIRCREVKGDKEVKEKLSQSVLAERHYDASNGKEIFVSCETKDERTLFGFLRLRFPPSNAVTPFPELRNVALIRELHVYGNLVVARNVTFAHGNNNSNSNNNNNNKNNNSAATTAASGGGGEEAGGYQEDEQEGGESVSAVPPPFFSPGGLAASGKSQQISSAVATQLSQQQHNQNQNQQTQGLTQTQVLPQSQSQSQFFTASTSASAATAGGSGGGQAQHSGVGRKLLFRAEELAAAAGYRFIAVISGVGVRNYYRKRGYELVDPAAGGFMIKPLFSPPPEKCLMQVEDLVMQIQQENQRRKQQEQETQGQRQQQIFRRGGSAECERDHEICSRLVAEASPSPSSITSSKTVLWVVWFALAAFVVFAAWWFKKKKR